MKHVSRRLKILAVVEVAKLSKNIIKGLELLCTNTSSLSMYSVLAHVAVAK